MCWSLPYSSLFNHNLEFSPLVGVKWLVHYSRRPNCFFGCWARGPKSFFFSLLFPKCSLDVLNNTTLLTHMLWPKLNFHVVIYTTKGGLMEPPMCSFWRVRGPRGITFVLLFWGSAQWLFLKKSDETNQSGSFPKKNTNKKIKLGHTPQLINKTSIGCIYTYIFC
jgi:hypothetical protein